MGASKCKCHFLFLSFFFSQNVLYALFLTWPFSLNNLSWRFFQLCTLRFFVLCSATACLPSGQAPSLTSTWSHPTDSWSHLLSMNSKTLSPPFPTSTPFYWLVLPTSMSGFCRLKESVPFVRRTLKTPATFKLGWGVHSLHPQLPCHPHPLLDSSTSCDLLSSSCLYWNSSLDVIWWKYSTAWSFSVSTLTFENEYPSFVYHSPLNLL